MVQQSFQGKIKELEQELINMGDMVTIAIKCALNSLQSQNLDEAEKVISGDLRINNKRWYIEEQCINFIATQQPVASDLREIITILNITTNLERMGDHAAGIGKIVLMYGKNPLVKPLIDIPRMAEKAISMLRGSLKAFVDRDADAARSIWHEDDEVDMLQDQVYRELLTYMIENPKNITPGTYLLWISHNLECISDRVTNICERIIYLVTGEMEKIRVSKY
jgi:phosphate transport system protein